MILTILTNCSSELSPDYLRLYREALLRWNDKGLAETQVILLPQSPLQPSQTDPFEVVETEYESVNGYPVWDLMRAVRQAWPKVQGEYVTFDHPEFIWGPGRLDKTIAWLKGYRPVYAMGNLRRPGTFEEIANRDARDDVSKYASDWFKGFLDRGDWDEAANAFEYLQTAHWMYWVTRPQKPGPNPWIEDAFYADKGWLDLWGFTRYDMELPFQDVYDLIQRAAQTLYQYGVPVQCLRMPESINRLIHLWHPRAWGSWTAEMRDWFLAQPDRWKKIRFGEREIWERLIAFRKAPVKDSKPVNEVRFESRGTATNYGVALAAWLNNGGVEAMRKFYAERSDARA